MWGGVWGCAVSSGFQNIKGGVISRETALKNVKGETLRLIKLHVAVRWNPPKSLLVKVRQLLSSPAALVNSLGQLFDQTSFCWWKKRILRIAQGHQPRKVS